MLRAGNAAPPVSLDGFELATVKEPVLLAFFKISCPTCQLIFPFLQRLADRGGPRVVGISQDNEAGTSEFKEEFGVRLETYIDPRAAGYAASKAYGLTHVPSLFLVQPGGRIDWVSEGFSRPELEELAGRWNVTLFDAADRVPVFKPG